MALSLLALGTAVIRCSRCAHPAFSAPAGALSALKPVQTMGKAIALGSPSLQVPEPSKPWQTDYLASHNQHRASQDAAALHAGCLVSERQTPLLYSALEDPEPLNPKLLCFSALENPLLLVEDMARIDLWSATLMPFYTMIPYLSCALWHFVIGAAVAWGM